MTNLTQQQLNLMLSQVIKLYLGKEPNPVLLNILCKKLKEQDKELNMLFIMVVSRYKGIELTFKLFKRKLQGYLGEPPIPELVELLFAELHEAKNPANWLDTQVFDRYEELAYYFEG